MAWNFRNKKVKIQAERSAIENVKDNLEEKFSALGSLLAAQQHMQNLYEKTKDSFVLLQLKDLDKSVVDIIKQLSLAGVSIASLYQRYGAQLYKSKLIKAQQNIANKEALSGTHNLEMGLYSDKAYADARAGVRDFDAIEQIIQLQAEYAEDHRQPVIKLPKNIPLSTARQIGNQTRQNIDHFYNIGKEMEKFSKKREAVAPVNKKMNKLQSKIGRIERQLVNPGVGIGGYWQAEQNRQDIGRLGQKIENLKESRQQIEEEIDDIFQEYRGPQARKQDELEREQSEERYQKEQLLEVLSQLPNRRDQEEIMEFIREALRKKKRSSREEQLVSEEEQSVSERERLYPKPKKQSLRKKGKIIHSEGEVQHSELDIAYEGEQEEEKKVEQSVEKIQDPDDWEKETVAAVSEGKILKFGDLDWPKFSKLGSLKQKIQALQEQSRQFSQGNKSGIKVNVTDKGKISGAGGSYKDFPKLPNVSVEEKIQLLSFYVLANSLTNLSVYYNPIEDFAVKLKMIQLEAGEEIPSAGMKQIPTQVKETEKKQA